jgi:toxin ParE1/3/4
MRRIVWTTSARADLAQIDDYLTGHDPAAAVRILTAIRARLLLLSDFPEIGPAFEGDIRRLSIKSTDYILFYRFEKTSIEIVRIRHAREDWLGEGER